MEIDDGAAAGVGSSDQAQNEQNEATAKAKPKEAEPELTTTQKVKVVADQMVKQIAEFVSQGRLGAMHAAANWLGGFMECAIVAGFITREHAAEYFAKLREFRQNNRQHFIPVSDLNAILNWLGFDAVDQTRLRQAIEQLGARKIEDSSILVYREAEEWRKDANADPIPRGEVSNVISFITELEAEAQAQSIAESTEQAAAS